MFPKGVTLADKEAVLKRSHFIVQTNLWFYVREATEEQVNVTRVKFDRKWWLREDAKDKYQKFLDRDYTLPADFDECPAWEHSWAKAALGRGEKPSPRMEIVENRPAAALAAAPLPPLLAVPAAAPVCEAGARGSTCCCAGRFCLHAPHAFRGAGRGWLYYLQRYGGGRHTPRC